MFRITVWVISGRKWIGIACWLWLADLLCFQWAEIVMKCTCDCSPTKSDLTFAGLPLKCQHHSLGGHFSESAIALWQVLINNCFFFSSLIDCFNNSPSTPIGIRHVVLAFSRECMQQSAIAGHRGLIPADVNRNLLRHAVTRTLVPGKSTGALRKTTLRQDRAFLRMVRQHCSRAFTMWMKNLYGMRVVLKTINNQLLSRGYRDYRPTRKPLLIASHRCLPLGWVPRWQNLTMAHWQHVIFSDESRFQLYLVDGRFRYVDYLVSIYSKGARFIGYKLLVVQYTSGELFTVVPNRLCSPTDTSLVSSTGTFCETA